MDIQHKGLIYNTQQLDVQHNDTQHKGLIYDAQNILAYISLSITKLDEYAECHYVECRYDECRGAQL